LYTKYINILINIVVRQLFNYTNIVSLQNLLIVYQRLKIIRLAKTTKIENLTTQIIKE